MPALELSPRIHASFSENQVLIPSHFSLRPLSKPVIICLPESKSRLPTSPRALSKRPGSSLNQLIACCPFSGIVTVKKCPIDAPTEEQNVRKLAIAPLTPASKPLKKP